jgi:hypothetical protein
MTMPNQFKGLVLRMYQLTKCSFNNAKDGEEWMGGTLRCEASEGIPYGGAVQPVAELPADRLWGNGMGWFDPYMVAYHDVLTDDGLIDGSFPPRSYP